MLGNIVSGLLQAIPKATGVLPLRQLSTILSAVTPTVNNTIAGGSWSLIPVRTHMRYHFPVAREAKRIKTHGWKKRMSTPEGRRIIMRRILKGRHCLSH